MDKNTWVVFTSDNGSWLPYKQAGGSAGPLRDGKNSHCEGGFRVPCIMWGGMVKPGHITQMGSTLDLLPTCCEMAGIDLPAGVELDGVSLLNVLQDSGATPKRENFSSIGVVSSMQTARENISYIIGINQLMAMIR